MRRFMVRVHVGEQKSRPEGIHLLAWFVFGTKTRTCAADWSRSDWRKRWFRHTWPVLPLPLSEFIPAWVGGIIATVPNIAIGIVILVFRKRILGVVKRLFPTMSEDAEFWVSRVILLGGMFLIVVAGFLFLGALKSITS